MNFKQLSATGSIVTPHSFAPKDNQMYKVLYGHCILVADATAADRRLIVAVKDSDGNIVSESHAGVVQTAGLTRHYTLKQGVYRETAFQGSELEVPIPQDCVIPDGYTVEFSVENVQAGDTLEVRVAVDSGHPGKF